MKERGLLQKIRGGLADAGYIWADEMRNVVRDEGMLIFFILVPLLYPLLYSWIYNNEVVREVPVVVVDDSHTAMSREFARRCDASPDVRVLCHANDMDEARSLLSRQVVKGIYYLPADFATRLGRMEQTAVSVYCDMSLMLTYKAVYQAAMAVSLEMNGRLQAQLAAGTTDRQDLVTVSPLAVTPVPVFNPAGGYGSFILPGVLMLILQQTLVLGIGLSAGTARETNRYQDLIPFSRSYQGIFRIVFGKSLCYFMIYAVLAAYLALAVPRLFGFVVLAEPSALLAIMLPYVLACIFFGMVMSCIVRYRENVMLLVVFASVPLLFLSGISWPQSNLPWFWESISWLFPSTFGIRAYIRVNTMGAALPEVATEYRALWAQAAAYFLLACGVYRYQINLSRRHAIERLEHIRRKRELRRRLRRRAAE